MTLKESYMKYLILGSTFKGCEGVVSPGMSLLISPVGHFLPIMWVLQGNGKLYTHAFMEERNFKCFSTNNVVKIPRRLVIWSQKESMR